MKYNKLFVLALIANTYALRMVTNQHGIKKDEDTQATVDEDIDSLMDKYDTQEKTAQKKQEQKKDPKPTNGGQPSASQIQDQELKILSGNNLAEDSERANEDDFFNEVLGKYLQPGKSDKDMKTLSKSDAKEAASDIYQEKKKLDSFAAMAEVNNVFNKFWTDHDILGKGVIDQNEAYSLLQDISRQI